MSTPGDDFWPWQDDPRPPQPRRAHGRRWPWLAASLAVLVAVAFALHAGRSAPRPAAAVSGGSKPDPAASQGGPASGAAAVAEHPEWTFTTLGGQTVTLDSLRGRPVMLWFVVAGCASCAVSVPAVAQNIHRLAADGVQVVAVDLYGDLDPAPKGIAELSDFAKSTVGTDVAPNWTWGLASKALSYAFDPTGNPDEYFFLSPTGTVRYQGSVPVSTMPQLLSVAARIGTGGNAGSAPAQPASTSTTLAQLP